MPSSSRKAAVATMLPVKAKGRITGAANLAL
jgi:hypothetical protein